jgi:hypothetical protein
MWNLLTAVALAQTPADPIQANVDRIYGKAVPKEAICVERPELGAPFTGAPAVVGVRRGVRGCVLLGVAVGEQWLEPGAALGGSIDRAAWDALDAAGRQAAWLKWTDEVLLAFDQPSADGLAQVTVDAKKKVTVVDRRYMRRDDKAGRSADAVSKWTFDNTTLAQTGAPTEQVLAREDVSLFQRADKLDGVSDAVVGAAIESKGLTIRKCFTHAWEDDLSLDGRVRLEWNVTGGKAAGMVIVTEEDTNEALAQCYARSINSAAFAADAKGSVRWVFGVTRTPVKE